MLGRHRTRTGLDIGTASVKLVRGEGNGSLDRITHLGIADYEADGRERSTATADALRRLLGRLRLRPTQLGRVAVAIGGDQISLREALVPELSAVDLRRALPFEAKKHLLLEAIERPQLDAQILGPAEANGDGSAQMRVLFAAASGAKRDQLLQTLATVGLEPEVVDLEPLALLNALYSARPEAPDAWGAQAIVDLGRSHARLHVGHPDSGVMTRMVGGRLPGPDEDPDPFLRSVVRNVEETLTYYRGHHRKSADQIHLSGGGSARSEIRKGLDDRLPLPTTVFDVTEYAKGATGREEVEAEGARLAVAYGLARWWDTDV